MTPDRANLERSISAATRAILDCQKPDGEWCFELEADCTIPAEYVLMRHYLGEPVDAELERKIAVYLRRTQSRRHGGWSLFHDGAFDVSATVKAYFALKMIGDSIDADHMRRAREAIHARGGPARANVFTRTLLALYGQISWRAVPMMPAEVMILPKWFPFHLDKISYWSRTVIVPLLVLLALKPQAKNAKGVRIDELTQVEGVTFDVQDAAHEIDGVEVRRLPKLRAMRLRGGIDLRRLDDLPRDPSVAHANPERPAAGLPGVAHHAAHADRARQRGQQGVSRGFDPQLRTREGGGFGGEGGVDRPASKPRDVEEHGALELDQATSEDLLEPQRVRPRGVGLHVVDVLDEDDVHPWIGEVCDQRAVT